MSPDGWSCRARATAQEGFPSTGVCRVRDVEAAAQQFRLGGAPGDANHTRIVDAASATEGEQEELLSAYSGAASLDGLGPDDFGSVPLLAAD